jgi:glycosyltransferase involved in cell wall biosynthesis
MKIIFSHPTGNANSRAASVGLAKAGMLYEFHTTLATFPSNLPGKISAFSPFAELKRRSFDPLIQPLTTMHPRMELGRMVASKIGLRKLTQHEKGFFSIDSVYRNLDNSVARRIGRLYSEGLQGVYAYEDGALASFKMAKQLGVKCFYDLPIGYWRSSKKFLDKEREKWPDWASTLTGLIDSDEKLLNKDEELQLADHLFVASSFTAHTLKEYPGKLPPVEVIPYGFPAISRERTYTCFANKRRLKILFVGGLSQRKGIADLFAAVDKLDRFIELTVVGSKPLAPCPVLDAALSRHRWISSLPHNEILRLMQEQDVFVFPSLFEGFGLVITEAMSQGTPVITTDRTAGPDIIKNNENGWLVEAGNTALLRLAIENLLQNPGKIKHAGVAARETASKRPWEVYGSELTAAIKRLH